MQDDIGAQSDDHEAIEPGVSQSGETTQPASPVGEQAREAVTDQMEEAGEEMSGLIDEAREAGAEVGGDLERAVVAAHKDMAGVAGEARAMAAEARETADDVVRATRERIAVAEERSMAPEYRGISFGDGFRFGCGFTVAGCLFWLVLSIILGVVPMVLAAMNVNLLPGR